MKKLLKILKKIGLVLASVLVLAFIVLLIIGVPKPPAISAENVPRVSLSKLKGAYSSMNNIIDEARFLTWSRNDDKMYIQKIKGFQPKLYILDRPGGKPQLVEGIPDYARVVAINPKPKKNDLIYSLDTDGDEKRQLYLFDLSTGESTLLSNGKDNHLTPRYSPSGDKMVFLSTRRNNKVYDIYLMDLDDPSSEKLIKENERFLYLDSWSPDGKQVVIKKYISATEKEPYILDLENGELTSLTIDSTVTADYGWQGWSNDGKKIYYPSNYQSEFKSVRMRNLETGKDSLLIPNINWDVSNIFESPDEKWLTFNANEDGVFKQFVHHIASGTTKTIENLPFGSVKNAYFHRNKNSTIGFNFMHVSGATDIYSYDLGTEELTKWFSSKSEKEFPDPEIIHYPTFDIDTISKTTREITAYYHKPINTSKTPYPVIIDIHGGPNVQAFPEQLMPMPLELKRGFALLVPNVRGSKGYGRTFSELDNGILREDAVKDIGALLDWVEKQPDLDANNIFVRGGSYGGYMAYACAMHYSNRLKGVISFIGPSDFIAGEKDKNKNADRSSEYGDINNPEMRQFLASISPINNVDKINVPLFIYHGVNDPRVKVSESRNMVEAFKKQGKEFWYLEASNEGHGFKRPWNFMYTTFAEFEFIDNLMEKGN